MKKELRIVEDNGVFCITEVCFDDKDKIIEMLDVECGILSYWMSVDELRDSYNKAGLAFSKPILKRI